MFARHSNATSRSSGAPGCPGLSPPRLASSLGAKEVGWEWVLDRKWGYVSLLNYISPMSPKELLADEKTPSGLIDLGVSV